jgi:hypothetical protein
LRSTTRRDLVSKPGDPPEKNRTEEHTMSDLTDEELAEYVPGGKDGWWVDDDVEIRMAAEIRRHRAALAADEGRVRSVVREVVSDVLGLHERDDMAGRIATRVAK